MAWPPIHPLGLILLTVVALATLLGILRILTAEYERFVAWHDLRAQCQEIRRDRLRMLLAAQGASSPAQRASAIRAISSAVRQMRTLEQQTARITAAQVAAGPFGGNGSRKAA